MTRYIVVGAGAVGGTIGGLLTQAGVDTVLVARGEHAAVMQRDGLRLGRPDGPLHLRPAVVTSVADLTLTPQDVLLLVVKSQDSTAVLTELAGLAVGAGVAADQLPVVCVQNGVNNEREALRRFADVHGICVQLPAAHLEPGKVQASGHPVPGVLDVGSYPTGLTSVDHQIAADLKAAGFGCTPRADVMAWKRGKLLRNLGNAVEALAGGGPKGKDAAAVREIDGLARAEALACFAAAGLSCVSDAEWSAYREHRVEDKAVDGAVRGGGSTWQSLARGAGAVEADYLNGEIVLLGQLHGVPTPVNAFLQRQVNLLAQQRGRPGSVAPATLLKAAQRAA
jgi:2-dehydropantoate 2-reductase